MRRVNKAIYMMVKGVREQAFRNIKSFPECLADEIIAASEKSPNSWAMKKKIETERAAQSNR
jgi:small subunit ribosomal protein S5e